LLLLLTIFLLFGYLGSRLIDFSALKGNGSTSNSPKPTSAETVSKDGSSKDATTATSSTSPVPASPKPTTRPTAEPMTPETTDAKILNSGWQTPAVFDGPNAFDSESKNLTESNGSKIQSWIFENNKPLLNYTPKDSIDFGKPENYADIEGVLAFRGNNYRNAPSFGVRTISSKKLEIVWESKTGTIAAENSNWPGTGWTGQPLLVHWPKETREAMNINPEMKAKDLVEVIYPTLDGNIYFLDLASGKETRKKIAIGFPFKGTGLIDPRGYPILYAGQGLNENGNKIGEFKYHIFNLLDQTPLYGILGRDPMAFRDWGAFDSSGLVDKKTDTFIECAENGLVYKTKLNTLYDPISKKLSIAPQLTKYRYRSSYSDELGIENSPAAWKNFLYFNDNGGILQCLDLNTMAPVWTFNTEDDTDSSTVIEETDGNVFLYTANEIDKRASKPSGVTSSLSQKTVTAKPKTVDCNIRKIDALTGRLLWQKNIPCIYNFYINGGVLGTPLIGKDDISDMVIYTVCFTKTNLNGLLIALDKKTGNEIWSRELPSYSWCSPVDLLSSDGTTYGIFTDNAGIMHLFDPKTGKDLDTLSLGLNVESSPAVYNDMIVVGSYAQKIFGIRIK
jgi:outer membrane protein assembly factor BamB